VSASVAIGGCDEVVEVCDVPILSFATDIKPLFREADRRAMLWAFDLWSRDDVSRHAASILETLEDGSMPCDERWPAEQIEVFRRWLAEGAAD
jgi:hypothetical protein